MGEFRAWEYVVIPVAVASTLVCLIMSVVFAYNVSLVYPSPYVNVVGHPNYTDFFMRCDVAADGKKRLELLTSCGGAPFVVEPSCSIPWGSYFYATYAFGQMPCPTRYLDTFTRTENLAVNLVILASLLMALGAVVFAVIAIVVITRWTR